MRMEIRVTLLYCYDEVSFLDAFKDVFVETLFAFERDSTRNPAFHFSTRSPM